MGHQGPRASRLILLLAVHATLAQMPARAQIAPSPQALPGATPIVDIARNGVDVVHIAAPSAAGVSHNQYGQFNVAPTGLILNNSAQQSATVLGGQVNGNPQLGPQPARIILNEVISAMPSSLRGVVEVAGSRADLIVANPHGIQCDGCGFLNAGRATLVAGLPRMQSDGSVQGFDIEQGRLGVGAGGLDARGLQQLDLLARGIVIEGPIQAERIHALAGANRVSYQNLEIQEDARNGARGQAPRFAIDISELGGMHAQQIYLLATEQGLGVNSQGRLAASGSLQLSSAGDLRHGGVLEAGGQLVLKAPLVDNHAEAILLSQGDLRIDGALRNVGGKVYAKGDIVLTGQVGNENADLRIERQTSTGISHEVHYADERTPAESHKADQVRFDRSQNLILPSSAYPFDRFGHEAYEPAQPSGQPGYPDTHPIWARFGMAEPSQDTRDTALAELQLKLDAFNADLEKRKAGSYFTSTVDQLQITEDKVVASQPGQIIAGGAIHIGGGINKDSFILAGGQFTSSAGFSNQATLGQRIVTAHGRIQRSLEDRHDDFLPLAALVSAESFPIDIRPTRGMPGLPVEPHRIDPARPGSLLAASDIRIHAPGERFANSGVLHAHGGGRASGSAGALSEPVEGALAGTVNIQAGHITHGGTVTAHATALHAEQDIVAVGGRINAPGSPSTSLIALQAGRNIELLPAVQGTQLNQGVSRAQAHLAERSSTLVAGHIHLQAGQDFMAQGADLQASGPLLAAAARHIDIGPSYENRNAEAGASASGHQEQLSGQPHWDQSLTTAHGSRLQAGQVAMTAGGNLALIGSRAVSQENLHLRGRNIAIEAAPTELRLDVQTVSDQHRLRTETQRQGAQGSAVTAGGGATLVADANLEVIGSQIHAQHGQASLIAGGDVTLEGAVTRQRGEAASAQQGGWWFSHHGKESSRHSASTGVQGTQVEGQRVLVDAGRDMKVSASSITSNHALSLKASRHIAVAGEQHSRGESSRASEQRTGFFTSGASLALGRREEDGHAESTIRVTERSAVGSLEGDVSIRAGETYAQAGSDLLAAGSIAVHARDIALPAMMDADRQARHSQSSQAAFTFGFGMGGFVGLGTDAVHHIRAAANAASGRTGTLRAIAALRSVRDAGQMLRPGQDQQGHPTPARAGQWEGFTGGIRIGGGGSESSRQEVAESDSVQVSTIRGRDRVDLRADPDTGTIRAVGAQVVGVKVDLHGRTIDLGAAHTRDRHEAGGSGSGLGAGVTQGAGSRFDAVAYRASDSAEGDDMRFLPAHIGASQGARIQAREDVNLRGAAMEADTVVIRTGGHLAVESLQDQLNAQAHQHSAEIGGGGGGGLRGGGVSGARARAGSEYAAVSAQSGIRAGHGGFDVEVKGTTRLVGGLIDSLAPEEGNRLVTDRLDVRDLVNVRRHQGSTVGGYVGHSSADAGNLGSGLSAMPGVPLDESGAQEDVTRSAIAPAAVTLTHGVPVTSTSRDARAAREKAPMPPPPDPRRILREHADLNAAVIASNPARMQRDWIAYASTRHERALQQGDARTASCWGVGGACRTAGQMGIDAFVGRMGQR